MTQRAAVRVLESPLPGYLHAPNWTRPAGGLDFKETCNLACHAGKNRALGTDWSNGKGGAPVFAMEAGVVYENYIQNTPGQTGHGARIVRMRNVQSGRNQGYAHLADDMVSVGQQVARGQQIGRVGNTGKFSNGTQMPYHLHCHDQRTADKVHFEVWALLAQNHAVQVNPGATCNLRATPAGAIVGTVRLDGIYNAAGVKIAARDTLMSVRGQANAKAAVSATVYEWVPRKIGTLNFWVARIYVHYV